MKRETSRELLRAFLASWVISLQLLGALHFSLVRHGYSAALGGVVHLHAAPSQSASKPPAPARASDGPALSSASPSCNTDPCSAANAPESIAPHFQALEVGAMAWGVARSLQQPEAHALALRRVLLGAPKTSPPV